MPQRASRVVPRIPVLRLAGHILAAARNSFVTSPRHASIESPLIR
jgi:hypothetical protein